MKKTNKKSLQEISLFTIKIDHLKKLKGGNIEAIITEDIVDM